MSTRGVMHAVMGAVAALCVLGSSGVALAQNARDGGRITLRGSDLPLGIILGQISRAAGLALVAEKDVRLDRVVPSPNLEDVPIDTALAVVLTPLGYSSERDEALRQLRVFVYETRTFRVAMPVVVQDWEAGLSNTGSGENVGSGNLGARVALGVKSDTLGIWDEVDKSMARLLEVSESGAPVEKEKEGAPALGSYSVNRVAGFVTVRALPSVMPAVKSYFDALNTEMGRSVSLETKVIQVDLNDTRAASLDWTLLAARLGDIAFVGGAAIRSTLTGSTAPFVRLSGRAGDAFIRALEEQGRVSVLAQPTLALGNNLPAIIELAQVQAYVAQQTTTIVGGGSTAAQTTVQTAALSDGLIISVLPRVLENGEISLAMAMVLQDVLEVRRENFADGFVELPKTSRRAYSGLVRARPNETLVIGGLITTRKEELKSGIPFLSRIPIVGWLFGATKYVDRRSELVITVTPRDVQTMTAAPAAPVRLPGAQ